MKNNENKALRVGLFVFGALTILVITIYLIGSKDNLFSRTTNVSCSFNDIRGVVVGNNVRFSGINVGTVRSIEVDSDNSVILTLSIAAKFAKHIYKNSLVEISQDGIVGNKLINISSGTSDAGYIVDGDKLAIKNGIDLENMLVEASNILLQTKEAITSLKSIALKLDTGNSDIAMLINDNTLVPKLALTIQRLNSTMGNVDQITRKLNSSEGDLGRLINQNELTTKAATVLDNLNQAAGETQQIVSNLQAITSNINEGEGLFNLLLTNPQTANNVDTTILKVQSSLEQFDRTAKAIEESWIVGLFSKKKKKEKEKQEKAIKDSIL